MSFLFWLFWGVGLLVSSLLGAYVVKKYREYGLFILGTFLAIYVVSANILVPRLINFEFFNLNFIIVTGAMIWPFTAQLTDMINEIYGKKASYLAAAVAYMANMMFVGFTLMAVHTPPFIASVANEPFFTSYFGVAGRVLFASMCSYTAANFVDIQVFSKIKAWAMGRELSTMGLLGYATLRSSVSDGLNMVIDSAIFYTIAFIGTMPNTDLWALVVSSIIAKVIISQIDLPFYWLFRLQTRDVSRTM